MVAVKEGGGEPSSNGKLRELIAKARSLNVPNDNIERVIKKAGDKDADSYESITYEGYGPGGVALIVDSLTDNRNRTAGDLRHWFDKYGGNLGQTGSVGFIFTSKGIILIENSSLNDDKVMEDCLESGAEDFLIHPEAVEVYTAPSELSKVRASLEAKGYIIQSGETEYIPSTYVKLEGDSITKMEKILELLEDNDDVQNVWHNWDDGQE